MSKVKKMMSFMLALLFILTMFSFAGCNNGTIDNNSTGGNGEQTNPDGDGNGGSGNTDANKVNRNVFMVGSWVTYYPYDIKSQDEQMKLISESGVNFNCFPYCFGQADCSDGIDDWLAIDELCSKYKMFYNFGVGGNVSMEKFMLDLDVSSQLFAADGGEYMLGYHIWDEPLYDQLLAAVDWVSKYYQEDKEHLGFINLNGSSGKMGVDMYSYVSKYAALAEGMIEYIGYDLYPFPAGGGNNCAAKFKNMEVMRKVGNEFNLKTHAFVQSCGWDTHRMTNYGEISWDVWGLLAYGFKAFSYFNYVCPPLISGEGFHTALINRDGTIPDQELFDSVAAMNWRVRAVGDVLMNYDCIHAYNVKTGYSEVEQLPKDYFITTDSANTVISYFEPKDGKAAKHIMLFNNSYTDGKTATFNVNSSSGLSQVEWFNPETKKYERVDISGGSFNVEFGVGEGKLYRIRGNVQG